MAEINLGAFGSTGPGGTFTLDSASNRLRGITPAQEQEALAEARKQGLTIATSSQRRSNSLTSDLNAAGLASSSLPDEEARLRTQSETNRANREANIERRFGETIERQTEIGEREIGGTSARLATTRGTGASSSRLAFIKGQVKDNANIIKQFESARETAILDADDNAAKILEDRINTLRNQDFQLRVQEFNESQALITGKRAERALTLQEEQAQFNREIGIAGITGIFRDKETLAGQQFNLTKKQFDQNVAQQGFSNALQILAFETQQASNEFNRQIQLQQLANSTPAGTEIEIFGTTMNGRDLSDLLQSRALDLQEGRLDLDTKLGEEELRLKAESIKIQGRKAAAGAGGIKDRLLTQDEVATIQRDNPEIADQIGFGSTVNDVKNLGVNIKISPDAPATTQSQRENDQVNRTLEIINANITERIFGTKGKLKEGNEGEKQTVDSLVNDILNTLGTEFDTTELNRSEIQKLIQDELDTKKQR